MDLQTAKELIAVLDEKIALLQRGKDEIMRLVSHNGDMNTPSVATPLATLSVPVRRVYEAMKSAGRKMEIKQIVASVNQAGDPIEVPRLRQILHQYKGRLFDSPKRGLWKARELSS